MALGPDSMNVESWVLQKKKNRGRRERKKRQDEKKGVGDGDGDGEKQSGFWVRFRFLGSCACLPSKSKIKCSATATPIAFYVPTLRVHHPNVRVPAESKSMFEKSRDDPVAPIGSSTPSSCTGSAPSTPKVSEELKVAPHLRKFSFSDLKTATRNFRPESLLGEGGFGCVFKGWIEEDGTAPVKPGAGFTVAVKTLNHDGLQGHKEWLAEVNFLGNLRHKNLVKLIGYCIEDDHRLLVYEFMPRGSLENHLFRRSLPLPWSIRMKIALGAAKGLAFLHEEAERPVIYRDFKTSNILLDADYNAKLSDFGLAKDAPEGDKTHVSTRVMGTYGYAAPEYVMTGHLTSKSDVYSFGVVLLEMLTGRRSMDKNRPNGEHNLVEWTKPYLEDRRKFFRLIDPRLEGHFSIKGVQKAAQLAALCLRRDQKARPLMTEVVAALTPLPNLKDMANSSNHFQNFQAERSRCSPNAKVGMRATSGFTMRNGQQVRSLSIPNCPEVSTYNLSRLSPKPDKKEK